MKVSMNIKINIDSIFHSSQVEDFFKNVDDSWVRGVELGKCTCVGFYVIVYPLSIQNVLLCFTKGPLPKLDNWKISTQDGLHGELALSPHRLVGSHDPPWESWPRTRFQPDGSFSRRVTQIRMAMSCFVAHKSKSRVSPSMILAFSCTKMSNCHIQYNNYRWDFGIIFVPCFQSLEQ